MQRIAPVLGMLAIVLVGPTSCEEQSFWCQQTPESEGRALRCQGTKSGCEKYLAKAGDGCRAQPEAYCFREGDYGLGAQMVCTATEADCNEWRKQRKKFDPTACALTKAADFNPNG